MIKELISIANELDKRGLYKEADKLDSVLDVGGAYDPRIPAARWAWDRRGIVWKNLKDMFGQSEEIISTESLYALYDRLVTFAKSGTGEDEDKLLKYISEWADTGHTPLSIERIENLKSWLNGPLSTGGHRDELLERIRSSKTDADEYMEYLLGRSSVISYRYPEGDTWDTFRDRRSFLGDVSMESVPTNPDQ